MSQLHVLVSGAGIAGSVVAYWLGKAGMNVTVIERAPALRMSGQGIDVRGKALEIIKEMGVEDAVRAATTKEQGLVFVDENNSSLLTLNASGSKSFTAEIEIIRSDLARILYDASLTTNHVKYEFDVSINSISQTSSKVTVDLSNGQSREYDLLVAADGVSSRTRNYIVGPDVSKSSYKTLNAFTAYFSIPREDQDAPRSRWYTTSGSRAVMLRPVDPTKSSAYINLITTSDAPRQALRSNDIATQKAYIEETFADLSWEVPRVLKGMNNADSDSFYFQELAQIKLPKNSWHQGRCVLVGDAAYCPSAFTGMGTTLAILGAYVLAGEIVAQITPSQTSASNTSNPPSQTEFQSQPDFAIAFSNYSSLLFDYISEIQKLPLDGKLVGYLNPQSEWGVSVLRWVLWLVDRLRLTKLQALFGDLETKAVEVPTYKF